MSENEKKKNKFRRSNRWNNFRRELKRKQKTDPVTGARLVPRAVCHHRDLKPENYEILSEERQVMLNPKTHEMIHQIYGDGNHRYDWRKRLEALREQCELMDRYI